MVEHATQGLIGVIEQKALHGDALIKYMSSELKIKLPDNWEYERDDYDYIIYETELERHGVDLGTHKKVYRLINTSLKELIYIVEQRQTIIKDKFFAIINDINFNNTILSLIRKNQCL